MKRNRPLKVSTNEIFTKLNNLSIHEAIGNDNTPPNLLKLATCSILCTPLTITVNSSISEV